MRKRKLVVEEWLSLMEIERERSRDAIGFALNHMRLGHEFGQIEYEMYMAEAWRDDGMQVYEFDTDFADSILGESWADLLPDCIGRRPHDSFFLKLPCGDLSEGAVVSVIPVEDIVNFDYRLFPDLDEKGVYFGGLMELGGRAVVNTGSEKLCICFFAISKTLDLMFDDTDVEVYPINLVANAVAYLCSKNADIVPSYKPTVKRANPKKKRSLATWSDVGYRIGADLRAYKRAKSGRSEWQGGSVRPHMRRAHWHHYWTGPRDGDRELELRWIAPTLVGAENPKSPTGHLVR